MSEWSLKNVKSCQGQIQLIDQTSDSGFMTILRGTENTNIYIYIAKELENHNYFESYNTHCIFNITMWPYIQVIILDFDMQSPNTIPLKCFFNYGM